MRFVLSIICLLGLSCSDGKKAASPTAAISVDRAMRSLKDIDIGESYLALKLHVQPSFQTPVYVEVFYEGPATYHAAVVKAYRLSGAMGGAGPGDVEIFYERALEPGEGALIFKDCDFWNQAMWDDVGGLDGTTWIIEAKQGDKYHEVVRWEPDFERELTQERVNFSALGRWMLETAGIYPHSNPELLGPQQDGGGSRDDHRD